MRINAPSPPVFSVPDTGPVQAVENARAVTPVPSEGGGGQAMEQPPQQPETEEGPLPGEEGFAERRGPTRRAEDRRQRQLPVMIDTRGGQDRRRQRRRDEDEPPPPKVDLKA